MDKKNAAHIYEMLVLFRNSGVTSVKISPCIVSNIGKENNEYHSPIFDKVKEQVKKSIEDIADDKFEIFDSYHELDQKFKKTIHGVPIFRSFQSLELTSMFILAKIKHITLMKV